MKTRLFLLALFVGLILSSCGMMASDGLDGTSWRLIYIRKGTALEDVEVTATFADGEVSGSAGCNGYSGPYQVDGNKITFGPIASTLMACQDNEIMDQETLFLKWLMDARTFTLEGDQLMIFRDGRDALTFVPQE